MSWPEPPSEYPLGDGRTAHAVERPSDVESLREAVSRRAAEGLAVYPQGGRTSLDTGGTPGRPGIVLETTGLDRVVDYPAADMTITVESGITLSRLQAILAEAGQRLPLDAPEGDRATLGGIYATNTSGPRRFGLGRPRDLIIGVSFVTGAGELVKGGGRVVKNVAGYDFPKLMTGSFGTLGVITQLTLKTRPLPEKTAIAWAALASGADAGAILDRLNLSTSRPVAVELLNEPASREVGGPLGLAASGHVVAVGFEGSWPNVAWECEAIAKELPGASVHIVDDEAAGRLWDRLGGFQASRLGPVSLKVSVRASAVSKVAATVDPGRWAMQAHAGSGIVWLHAIGEDWTEDTMVSEVERIRKLAVADGGNVVVPRAPAGWKSRLKVWGEPRGDWMLMERVKAALDPGHVLNPGRFIGTI